MATAYVIENSFDGTSDYSAIQKAAAYLVVQGGTLENVSIVGDEDRCYLYYRVKDVTSPPPVLSSTPPVVGPSSPTDTSSIQLNLG